jgi:TetR/AcrR family transcriptional regulator
VFAFTLNAWGRGGVIGGSVVARTGDRKDQILQTLAEMLEGPRAEKITTAALAARLGVSEAALYRHFASKAQMFEGLIEFIEKTLFSLINKLITEERSGMRQVEGIVSLLLGFSRKNPGMTRVLIGDALINENDRLQLRINQLHDRLEATLKQALRFGASEGEVFASLDASAQANLLMCFVTGRWHQFAKSGFKRDPLEHWETQRKALFSSPGPGRASGAG